MTTFDPTSPPGPNDTYSPATATATTTDPFAAITAGAQPKPGAKRSTTPIGVPKGFTTPFSFDIHAAAGETDATPYAVQGLRGVQYFSGDEWTNLPPNGSPDLIALQQSLIQTGLLSSTGVVLGSADSKTASAMAKLLAASNSAGTQWEDTLAARLAAKAQGDQLTAPRTKAPLVIKLTDPNDIKAVVRTAAQKILGGDLDPGELDQFVANYQTAEQAYQTQSYTAGGFNPETGQQDPFLTQGVDTSGNPLPPSTGVPVIAKPPALTQGGVEEQLRAAHPDQATVTQFGNSMDNILSTLRQSA